MARDAAHEVDRVIGRLRGIGRRLPPGDGVAVFNRMYLTVTEAVRRRLTPPDAGTGPAAAEPGFAGPGVGNPADGGPAQRPPYFADPAAMAELDVLFARRYLLAVDADAAGRRPPACWRPLFELRAHPGVHPLQFAVAGMTAHIQHDLPLAVLDTCRRLGCAPERLADDYRRINGLLAAVETGVREQLMPGPDALERAEPLTHMVGAWSVDAARDAAWSSVGALWELRAVPCAAAALATALDASVGLLGRALLTPLGLAPPGLHGPAEPQSRTAGRFPGARNRPAVGRA
ncbi:DUF5995 family protein [Kitasatospora sp. NBC_01560]|uniref:DUF5995 family protein n=1 Tax=Kitasatospora sp. NBC_01560 TaxID=2975965 RepID=UPI00386F2193